MDTFRLSKYSRKFYMRRNSNKIDSIEIGRMVIAHLLPRSNQENYLYIRFFSITDDKLLSPLLSL